MSERFRERFTGGDGREICAACVETETEWVLYSEQGFVTGEVITRLRDGAAAIVSARVEGTPLESGLRLERRWAKRFIGQ